MKFQHTCLAACVLHSGCGKVVAGVLRLRTASKKALPTNWSHVNLQVRCFSLTFKQLFVKERLII